MNRIRILIPKDMLKKKDSNFQDKRSEFLKKRSEDFGEKAKGFKSSKEGFEFPWKLLKQKVEKRKRDSNLHKEDPNPSFGKMKNKARDLNLCKKDPNPFIKRHH